MTKIDLCAVRRIPIAKFQSRLVARALWGSLTFGFASTALAQMVGSFEPKLVASPISDANKSVIASWVKPVTTLQLDEMSVPVAAKTLQVTGDKDTAAPKQIGVGRALEGVKGYAELMQRLTWTQRASGEWETAIRIVSPGAAGVRLGVLVNRLDPRASLRFVGPNGPSGIVSGLQVLDSVFQNVSANPHDVDARIYVGPHTNGDEVTLEMTLPAGIDPSGVSVELPFISHLTVDPLRAEGSVKVGESGSCNVDTACRPDWTDTGKSVALMVFSDPMSGDSYLCTGTLLNDNGRTATPYLLTANHCVSRQIEASNLQTFWFYQAATCGSRVYPKSVQVVSGGATLLYTVENTDTTLLRLNQNPPQGVRFQGWSASAVSLRAAIGGVHHPQGDLQKVSLGTLTGFRSCMFLEFGTLCTAASASTGSHLTASWSSGTTERGSSGSGVYVTRGTDRYLVGVLSSGKASCDNPSGLDNYGRFDLAYAAGLSKWLAAPANLKPRVAVYRFYNTTTRAHFFTSNAAERDWVISTLPQFQYEGVAFYARDTINAGLSPVERFYNTRTGAHFYTINPMEKDWVVATLPDFKYEGQSWYASSAADSNSIPLYRFYNEATKTHFYTASQPERDWVIATQPSYSYEGVGYYVWNTP